MSNGHTRVAVIGLGEAGFTIHLPALRRIPEVSLVGAADSDPTRRARAGERFHVPVFASLDEILSATRADVVIVATPPEWHAEHCLQAIAGGADVICEKPFVSSVTQADQVIETAARANRRLAVNHQFREMPIFRALREEVARPDSGEIAFAQVWQLMDLPPWDQPGWRGRMTQRTLYEAGVHLLDLLIALFGEHPVAVQASTSAGGGPAPADAVALVTLEFSRGRLAHVTQNRLCKGPMQYFEVRVEMAGKSLRASFGGRSRFSVGMYRGTTPHLRFEYGRSGLAWIETGAHRTVLARNPSQPMVAATQVVIERTLEAFRTGGIPSTTAEAAREIIMVIAACYESAATGRRIPLDAATRATLGSRSLGVAASG